MTRIGSFWFLQHHEVSSGFASPAALPDLGSLTIVAGGSHSSQLPTFSEVYHVDPLLCGGLSGSATPSLPPVRGLS